MLLLAEPGRGLLVRRGAVEEASRRVLVVALGYVFSQNCLLLVLCDDLC